MVRRHVQAGKDTLLRLADRASSVDAIAEFIWNAIDAEARQIEVSVSTGELGGPEEIVVRDDGHGMTYEHASGVFLVHGESWKATQRFSPNLRRPMHGQLGRGRFLTYTVAERATWTTIAFQDDVAQRTTIRGSRSHPNEYDFDGPHSASGAPGTVLTLAARQSQKVARLIDSKFILLLTARLAPTLLAMKDVSVRYRDTDLAPSDFIDRQFEIPLEGLTEDELHGHPEPRLKFIEWSHDMSSRSLFLCDENGAVVTEHELQRMPPAGLHWSAYLEWQGFSDPSLMGGADMHVPEVQHAVLLAKADEALAAHLMKRLGEQRGYLIAEWKSEGVYPYYDEPTTPAERVEREMFDIVAVVASPAIGKQVPQKKLSLQLLRETVRAEPSRVRRILNAVMSLRDDEQDMLAELLERTHLGAIVQAAQTIADRSDFIRGLERLLYSDETRRVFREVDQLHPLLVEEPWVFGDEWALTLTESGLTNVVESSLARLGQGVEFAPTPVKLPSGKRGRVDLVFYRVLHESERSRHLVVELKRPKRLTMVEYGQLNNYATAVTSHPQVAANSNAWDFWLIGTDVDDSIRNQWTDSNRPGLVLNGPTYRLWIVTWAMLLDQSDRRLAAFRDQLAIEPTAETGRSYLQRVHAEFIPPETEVDK